MDEQAEIMEEAMEEAEVPAEEAAEQQEAPETDLMQLREELESAQRELEEGWTALRQERRLDMVGRELEKRGLAAGFAPYILRENDEESMKAVEDFEKLFLESMSRVVAGRMSGGRPPREPAQPKGYRRGELSGLSRGEINAHWEEVMKSLRE